MVAVSLKKIFFKQKTAYEIMSGDWSSDVCSSDLSVVSDYALYDLLNPVSVSVENMLDGRRQPHDAIILIIHKHEEKQH